MPSPIRWRPSPDTLKRSARLLSYGDDQRHAAVARLLAAIADGRLHVSTDEMIHPRDILGNAGVRRVCGRITRHTLIRWRNGVGVPEPFPEPIRKVNGCELWSRTDVKRWLDRRAESNRRPPA